MIRKICSIAPTKLLNQHLHFGFSFINDPFYILGVDKNADFKQIKKAFYQLANEYHPDKRNDKQSGKKFILIKQAYEAIKIQKGLAKPNKGYSYQEDISSMRPNPQQFDTSNEQFMHKKSDYTMYNQKAQANDSYETFRGTFKTLNDINSIKIRVEKGKMKDSTQRFRLQQLRVKNNISRSSIIIFAIGSFIFYVLISSNIDYFNKEQSGERMHKQEQKQKIKKTVYINEEVRKKQLIKSAMQMDKSITQFAKGMNMKLKNQSQKLAEIIKKDFESV